MANEDLTATEKLELHNLVTLATRARDKQRAGKPLTQAEIAAVGQLEARQAAKTAAPTPTIQPSAIVKMIIALEPKICDEPAIREVLGDAFTKSLPEIAGAFGVSHATVKHTWRSNGMPGDGKKRIFPWADTLIWWLNRNLSNTINRGGSEYTQQLNELELRRVGAVTRIQERKAEVIEGGHAPLWAIQSWLRGVLNLVRDGVMAVPPKFRTRFPAKFANEWVGDMENELRGVLTMIADKADSAEEILERSKDV